MSDDLTLREKIAALIEEDQAQLLTDYEVSPDAWKCDPDRTDAVWSLADAVIEQCNAEADARIEELEKERDEAEGARIVNATGLRMQKERADALAARLKEAEEALRPFHDFAKASGFDALPDDMPLTQGSRLARRQVTAGDFKRAAALLARLKAREATESASPDTPPDNPEPDHSGQ